MSLESDQFNNILTAAKETAGPYIQNKLSSQLEQMFHDSGIPVLFSEKASMPFRTFFIAENHVTNIQIAAIIESKRDKEFIKPGLHVRLRLLDRNSRILTQAILYIRGDNGRSGVVFYKENNVSDVFVKGMQSNTSLEFNPVKSAEFEPTFLLQVSETLDGASINHELNQKVLKYYLQDDGRWYTKVK